MGSKMIQTPTEIPLYMDEQVWPSDHRGQRSECAPAPATSGVVPVAKRPKPSVPAPAPARAASRPLFSSLDTQVIYCGDNIEKLRDLPDACIDLIYIDPPFNSNRNYEVFWGETREARAFEDRHESTVAYIDFMRPRCKELFRVLGPSGCFYYHCDWHAGHYVKVMLDQLFGENNFLNEIVWQRTSAHNDPNQYGRVHDTILMYTKGMTWTWNQQYEPADERFYKAHDFETDDQGRKFRKQDLTANKPGGDTEYEWRGVRPPTGRYWAYSKAKMEELEAQGKIVYTRTGMPRLKVHVENHKGIPLQSVWAKPELWLNSAAKERQGYPTQKPLALLDRIIKTSSNSDDIVLDAFCGCGTTLVSAEKLGRRWIGIDMSPTACRVMSDRLERDCSLTEGRDFIVRDLPHTEDQLRRMPDREFENWAVIALGGVPNVAKVNDKGIDGRIYPISAAPASRGPETGEFGFMDHWYPVQVKNKTKAGRQDIDLFETAMRRAKRKKGFFVSFDYTQDAEDEIRRFWREEDVEIVPVKVSEILSGRIPISLK
jgi:DNA modification methylase